MCLDSRPTLRVSFPSSVLLQSQNDARRMEVCENPFGTSAVSLAFSRASKDPGCRDLSRGIGAPNSSNVHWFPLDKAIAEPLTFQGPSTLAQEVKDFMSSDCQQQIHKFGPVVSRGILRGQCLEKLYMNRTPTADLSCIVV